VSEAGQAASDPSAAEVVKRRRIGVWALIVVGAVVLFVGSFTIWAKKQLLDNDTWTENSAKLLDDPQIREQLSVFLVDELYSNVDVEAQLQQRLPPALQSLAAPVAGLLYQSALRATDRLLESPRVQTAWEEANRRTHAQLVDVLKGREGKRITTANGDVVLDLSPLLVRIEQRFGISGELQPGAGQIRIMRANQLEAAQKAVRAVDVLSSLIGLLSLLFFAVAVYLAAGWRREAIRGAAVSVLVGALLLLVVQRVGGQAVTSALVANDNYRGAALTAWSVETDVMRNLAYFGIALAVLALIGTWLASPGRLARRARGALAGPFRDHVVLVYTAYVAIAAVVLLVAPISLTRAFGLLALTILGGFGVAALRRQTLEEFPEPAGPVVTKPAAAPRAGPTATG
jgi:hypothetical protein